MGGDSFKVELTELSDVSDWSKLDVSLGSDIVTYTRRTNSLYFKGVSAGEVQVMVSYDGSFVRSFKLVVTA